MRDEFGFTQLTLMGKDTQRILWFISEVMYQTYFCRSPYTALKLTRLVYNSSIYNFFVRFTGFVLIFFLYFFYNCLCRKRRGTCCVSSAHSYSAHALSFVIFLIYIYITWLVPSILVLIFSLWLTGSCRRGQSHHLTHIQTCSYWPHSSRLLCLKGADFSPRCRSSKTDKGESRSTQKREWGADLVALFTLFVLNP